MGYAVMVSLLAGLFTAVGGAFAILFPPKEGIVSAGLGFAAGVMVTVSLGDMLPEAFSSYCEVHSRFAAAGMTISLFCMGVLVAVLLGACLPDETELQKKNATLSGKRAGALRSAMVTVVVVVLHNLPEGILTLFTSYSDPKLGLTVALAIGMHNFPEGIVIAAPVYYATQNRAKAFWASLLSGLAEPLGAVLAFWVFKNWLDRMFLNGLLAVVAGMMTAVSFTELLDMGYKQTKSRPCALGAIFGCAAMSLGIYCIS